MLHVEPMAVKPRTAAILLDCSLTTIYELIKRGELRTVPFQSDHRILMEDVRRVAKDGVSKR
jgi:excisionase family DNA binding protein